jgi:hypothetical protein
MGQTQWTHPEDVIAQPPKKKRGLVWWLARISITVIVVLVFVGVVSQAGRMSGRETGSAQTQRPEAPAPDFPAISISGSGYGSSEPFTIPGGDVKVVIRVRTTAKYASGCYHSNSLRSNDGSVNASLVGEEVPKGITATLTGYAYNLPAGTYHVESISGCGAWSGTVSRP